MFGIFVYTTTRRYDNVVVFGRRKKTNLIPKKV